MTQEEGEGKQVGHGKSGDRELIKIYYRDRDVQHCVGQYWGSNTRNISRVWKGSLFLLKHGHVF